MSELSVLKFVTLAAFLVAAVVIDLRSHRIPNRLCAAALVAGLLFQSSIAGFDGLWSGACGALVGGAILLPLFLSGGMGAGDVKLMAAVGAFVGASGAAVAALVTIVIGGALGIAVALWKQVCLWGAANEFTGFRNAALRAWTLEFPYALAIAMGGAAGASMNWLRASIQ